MGQHWGIGSGETMKVVDEERSRKEVIRSLNAAMQKHDVPAVLLADIVTESKYDLHTVHDRLQEFRRETDGRVNVGISGGVTIYWLDDTLETDPDMDGNEPSIAELVDRIEWLERAIGNGQ